MQTNVPLPAMIRVPRTGSGTRTATWASLSAPTCAWTAGACGRLWRVLVKVDRCPERSRAPTQQAAGMGCKWNVAKSCDSFYVFLVHSS